MKSKVLKICL